mmetsp:Transcript_826/g.1342  ORF Transcript_826/g.1342 Transcript_826/m.1342 type:complete len:1022 (-) Transcript_826:133-3198(-)|eukprot:CAMPEP_0184672198 /NCGR_PEP_ID=MMETSP0308-20130426/85958_1 /TAXON_ID=38269 /ORGANISM="Gloeochaete witrockiana, Strain SAG 46.84" /LENGTH=1021 /DNA_ID=CAMNT_0027119489 /DNA_START=126 /DNA_END=3191 /DNA_ORIENTATION=-
MDTAVVKSDFGNLSDDQRAEQAKEDEKELEKALKHEEKLETFDDDLEKVLKTDVKAGLKTAEAENRLLQFGRNEIPEKKTNPFLRFLSYFTGGIAYLIEAACIFSAVVQDWLNFGVILALLFVNAFIGFIEEAKAESALDALKQTLSLKAKVRRDGDLAEVESALLVPGDIVLLRIGDIIPADCRLLGLDGNLEQTDHELQVDQSALTGESLPVSKHKGNVVYSSATIKQGQQIAVVCKTGDKTYIGRAANLISITNEAGHFQKVIETIGNFLILITIVTVVILLIYETVKVKKSFLESLTDALVLTIAAIPVGLPTVLSVTMAVGAKQLAKKQVIVKRLTAVEEMAAVDILCSDKTGTLTLNQLTLDNPFLNGSAQQEDLLFTAYLASEAGANDAIEIAVRAAAESTVPTLQGKKTQSEIPGFRVLQFIPFNPVSKYTQSTVQNLSTGETYKVAKGAPQVIIRLCGGHQDAHCAVLEFAKRGLRALGVARTYNDKWELVGLLSLLDPPRPDSADTIRDVAEYGVDTKMITGDQLVIAKEVARRLGMKGNILNAESLIQEGKSEDELARRCQFADGFAQVIPEHKYRVVELLQMRGHVAGMTGDGVNDAPALKKANVGIAVHGCTDAARSASDIVLLQPGLSTIVDGIKTSREIFQRMRSYAVYRITSTIHFLVFFFITLVTWGWSLPAKQIVLICILNDAATLVISVDHAKISQKPNQWRLGQLLTLCLILALMLCAASFAMFFIARDCFGYPMEGPNSGFLQTVMYLQISSCPHFVIFGTRLAGPFWQKPPSLVFFVAIMGTQVFAMFISIYGVPSLTDPIGWPWGLAIMGSSLAYFVVMDAVKCVVYYYWDGIRKALVPGLRQRLHGQQLETEKGRAMFLEEFGFANGGDGPPMTDHNHHHDQPVKAGPAEQLKAPDTPKTPAVKDIEVTVELGKDKMKDGSKTPSAARLSREAAAGVARRSMDMMRRSVDQVKAAVGGMIQEDTTGPSAGRSSLDLARQHMPRNGALPRKSLEGSFR